MKNLSPTPALFVAASLSSLHHGNAQRMSFSGAGMLECNQGQCEFSVADADICNDPCHTHSHNTIYDFSLRTIARTSNRRSHPTRSSCYYFKTVTNINTNPILPDNLLYVEEGCSGKCTGCKFYPTKEFEGPAFLDCVKGMCTSYTESEEGPAPACYRFFDDLGEASEDWAEMQTLMDGTDTVQTINMFGNINTVEPVVLRRTCKTRCYGCAMHKRKFGNKKTGTLRW